MPGVPVDMGAGSLWGCKTPRNSGTPRAPFHVGALEANRRNRRISSESSSKQDGLFVLRAGDGGAASEGNRQMLVDGHRNPGSTGNRLEE